MSSEKRVHFCLPRSFRRRLRNDLRRYSASLSSSSLDAEKLNNRESANAHLLLFSLIRDTKTERPMSSETHRVVFCLPRSFRRRLRNDLRQDKTFFIIIARRRETEQPRERKRTFFFFLYISSCTERTKTDELRYRCSKVFRDRSEGVFGTIAEDKNLNSSSELIRLAVAKFFSFLFFSFVRLVTFACFSPRLSCAMFLSVCFVRFPFPSRGRAK